MNRKAIVWVAAALVLAAASIWTGPSATAERAGSAFEGPGWSKGGGESHYRGEMTGKEFEAYRLERMKEMASYFGIPTEGKSAEQLRMELRAAKEANAEKWEAFKAEHRAKRLEHLKQIAQEHGIKTEGKTAEQLHRELRSLHGDKAPRKFKDKRKESVKEEQKAAPTPKAEPKVEQKTEPKPVPKIESKPAPKQESQSEPKPAPKIESKSKAEPVPKSGKRAE